jgi:hypothetical protein
LCARFEDLQEDWTLHPEMQNKKTTDRGEAQVKQCVEHGQVLGEDAGQQQQDDIMQELRMKKQLKTRRSVSLSKKV